MNAINLRNFTRTSVLGGIADTHEGMKGNGPTQGTPVDHRVCVAGTDWLNDIVFIVRLEIYYPHF
jgi:uncharacterized protein (DUF362 family)